MPRLPGTKVRVCPCGRRLVGLPGQRVVCPGCAKTRVIPRVKGAG